MARTARTRRLTAIAVKRYAESNETKELHDGGGLYLRRRDAGAYWYLRMVSPVTERPIWHKLFADDPGGTYPRKSLEDARREAERIWSLKDAGKDPRLEKAKQVDSERQAAEFLRQAEVDRARKRLTVRDLFDRWQAVELAPSKAKDGRQIGRKDGGALVKMQLAKHTFPTIGDLQAADVRRADVMAVLDAIRAAGLARTANVVLSSLRQMFRFAAVREIVTTDPTLGISKRRDAGGNDVERTRVLEDEELEALSSRLPNANLSTRTQLAIWIMSATLCRVGELIQARWAELDLENKVWLIPPENAKNKKEHLVHLSDFAVAKFKALFSLQDHAEFMFPGRDGKSPMSPKTINKQLQDRQRDPERKMKHRAKNTSALILSGGHWTPHDLRRTGATLMSKLGVATDVIHLCQNHTPQDKLARIYIQNDRMPDRKRAFEVLGSKLAGLVETRLAPEPKIAHKRRRRSTAMLSST